MTTVHDLLREGASAHGERTAILFEEETVSYADLLRRGEGMAGGLRALGVGENEAVAIIMGNSVECVLTWLGVSLVGCTDVPINPQYRGDLLLYLLRDSNAAVVICDSAYLRQVVEVAHDLPFIRLILVNGPVKHVAPSGVRVVDVASCMASTEPAPNVAGSDERVILYTSGTTGPSKGVVHTQASCLTLARYNAEVLRYDETDRLLNFFPLYHQNARYTGVLPALCAGASIRLEKRFSSSGFWKTVDADGTTAFNYLGSVLRMIQNVTPPERVAGTHTLKKAFGAGAPPAIWERFETQLGVRLVEVYGLSEAPMAALNTRGVDQGSPIGSAGRSSELFELAVVDEHDRMLPPDEIGEIVMRPKRPDAMMLGYHNKDAATVRAFRNLWFHSGDRGRLSADGDLYFEERGKDSIRRRGENISAWEVESVLDRHPDVAESAVYALPSEEADEEVAAALILRGLGADLADILAFAEQHLPTYAVPTVFKIVSDLPRTPTAKVQKGELRSAGTAGCTTRADIKAASAQRA